MADLTITITIPEAMVAELEAAYQARAPFLNAKEAADKRAWLLKSIQAAITEPLVTSRKRTAQVLVREAATKAKEDAKAVTVSDKAKADDTGGGKPPK